MRRISRAALTLVEMLVAMAVTLIMMGAVVTLFGTVGNSITGSRAVMEISERLRNARNVLQRDLSGVTVTMLPPRRPESDEGYFEYIERPANDLSYLSLTPPLPDGNGIAGDTDDILAFTIRSRGEPFVGRVRQIDAGGISRVVSIESQVAEVVWFVRGRTLYRRLLLVIGPSFDYDLSNGIPSEPFPTNVGFYSDSDVSVRLTTAGANGPLYPNTLGDLTKRENRFGHGLGSGVGGFPFPATVWGWMGMPILEECSDPNWPAATVPTGAPFSGGVFSPPAANPPYHPLTNPIPYDSTIVKRETGALTAFPSGIRVSEDVILTNVMAFDVRAYDPTAPLRYADANNNNTFDTGELVLMPSDVGYSAPTSKAFGGTGAYVNLNFDITATSYFSGSPSPGSGLASTPTYDTWSMHYEQNGNNEDADSATDEGLNGLDDGGASGIVDDPAELEAPPPYSVPLRGIQVKIRVYEPDSRQVREVTVVQDFMPQ